MTTAPKAIDEGRLTTDELMLNELERRDGIYSFIFHELENPPSTPATPSSTIKGEQLDIVALTTATSVPASADPTLGPIPTAPSTATPSAGTLHSYDATIASFNRHEPPIELTSALSPPSPSTSPPPPSLPSLSMPMASGTSNTMLTGAVNFIKFWRPITLPGKLSTASSAYGAYHHAHPCASSYAALNCSFRVRIAKPRFSHVGAQLVRDRQHALKETANYKSYSDAAAAANSKPPDMRALFPHDPDVHAPFLSACEASAPPPSAI